MWKQLLFIGLGFLSGSVLYSRYLPKILKGVDIVALSEDHNPGTANVMKYAGVQIGILCLLCDLAKGFVPVFVAARQYADAKHDVCADTGRSCCGSRLFCIS